MTMKRILWVDDDRNQVLRKIEYLEDEGYVVDVAPGPRECLAMLAEHVYDLVILDIMMRHSDELDRVVTRGGLETGVALAKQIRKLHSSVPIVGCSVAEDEHVGEWFRARTAGFWVKTDVKANRELVRKVEIAMGNATVPPQIFIVHGHSEIYTLQLKNYLQNTLKMGEPIILREEPSSGRTIIEKFEQLAQGVELVFVLLTSDDALFLPDSKTIHAWRARQNVIFELGYFYGRLNRRSGRVILLYQGALDIPTDISGIVYIDVSAGIEAAGEEIRRELSSIS